jgi:hypothetical protein
MYNYPANPGIQYRLGTGCTKCRIAKLMKYCHAGLVNNYGCKMYYMID